MRPFAFARFLNVLALFFDGIRSHESSSGLKQRCRRAASMQGKDDSSPVYCDRLAGLLDESSDRILAIPLARGR